jgi:archaeosortase A (PGF-CTERM-specific)
MPGPLTDAFAWVVILAFSAGVLAAARTSGVGRRVVAGAWGLFALFWLVLFPHFAFTQKSYVEGVLALAAVPACLYAGKLLLDGRDSLLVLSRAVAVMGLIYLPFETVPAFTAFGTAVPAPKAFLIETVAAQTGMLVNALGYHPTLMTGPQGYDNTYQFVTDSGHQLRFTVVLACTGLGSMTIFAGLIAAVDAPFRRKMRALSVAVPIIYGLNIVRTTFIGVAFGTQQMQWFVDEVLFLFGATDPYRVSFFLSDRVVSQVLAVFALVGVTYLVVRELPELLTVVEDVLYIATGREHDLRAALDLGARPDGGTEKR